MRYFWKKLEKLSQRYSLDSGGWVSAPDPIFINSLYRTVTTFYPSVLAVKRFIVVKKEQNVPISYFKLYAVFVGESIKYYLLPGTAVYPSYATERWRLRFRP